MLVIEPGRSRGALAAVRTLSQAGYGVGVGNIEAQGLAAVSRHTDARHRLPPPAAGLPRFVQALQEVLRKGSYDVVLPAGDAECFAVSAVRGELSALVPYPAHRIVERMLDKSVVYDLADKVGLSVPITRVADDLALRRAKWPAIIKGNSHALAPPNGRLESALCKNEASGRAVAARLWSAGAVPLLQPFLTGRLEAYIALTAPDGSLIADQQQVATATWPTPVGVSVRARTVPVAPQLARQVGQLLTQLGWFGLAQVQFLSDGNERWLIDVNGRLYGSMGLASCAGLPIAEMWIRSALGEQVRPATSRVGVRYQWFEGDLRRAGQERRRGLALDVSSCVATGIVSGRNSGAWADPIPALSQVGELLRRAAHRRPASSL